MSLKTANYVKALKSLNMNFGAVTLVRMLEKLLHGILQYSRNTKSGAPENGLHTLSLCVESNLVF